jgi:hypothetical protein
MLPANDLLISADTAFAASGPKLLSSAIAASRMGMLVCLNHNHCAAPEPHSILV